MGQVDWLAVALGTLAFFLVGALWYGGLFRKAWQAEAGVDDPPRGAAGAKVMLGTLFAEFMVVAMLGHLIARTQPPGHVKLMMAAGFALTVMAPAIGISYLHQKRSMQLFLIDAGHYLVGMLAAGAVFALR
ncbi:MAG: DUF1761 domain-containing protein [Sphingomonadales bacterium]|nr:DUF1761 domain-containing protein [Sphingomonadales bacterium]MBU3993719.1 DUF1761 domain-containing protein [Alphaproteobacteria bacterium]